jgi:hypothetical protein
MKKLTLILVLAVLSTVWMGCARKKEVPTRNQTPGIVYGQIQIKACEDEEGNKDFWAFPWGAEVGVYQKGVLKGVAISDSFGNYGLVLPVGTYDIIATSANFFPDTNYGVEILENGNSCCDFFEDTVFWEDSLSGCFKKGAVTSPNLALSILENQYDLKISHYSWKDDIFCFQSAADEGKKVSYVAFLMDLFDSRIGWVEATHPIFFGCRFDYPESLGVDK